MRKPVSKEKETRKKLERLRGLKSLPPKMRKELEAIASNILLYCANGLNLEKYVSAAGRRIRIGWRSMRVCG